jgi:hypothetical protein
MAARAHPSLDGILDRAVLVRTRRRAPDEQGGATSPRSALQALQQLPMQASDLQKSRL